MRTFTKFPFVAGLMVLSLAGLLLSGSVTSAYRTHPVSSASGVQFRNVANTNQAIPAANTEEKISPAGVMTTLHVRNTVETPSSAEGVNTHKPVAHKDGTIASIKLVHGAGENPAINIYEMFYWSQGYKVEAFVTEPKGAGPTDFPLYVSCHGGYVFHVDKPDPAIVNITNLSEIIALTSQNNSGVSNTVELFPEYRGYAQSGGSVSDVYSNTVDTENAIVAAESLPFVNNKFLSLAGVSMGGAVALQVASSSKYATSLDYLVIESPFVGWDSTLSWAEKHPGNKLAQAWIDEADSYDSSLNLSNPGYRQNSIDILKIDPGLPILILQGTGDHVVPWQATQLLAQKMRAAGDRVHLDLVPRGNHGLTGKYATIANQDFQQWLKEIYQ